MSGIVKAVIGAVLIVVGTVVPGAQFLIPIGGSLLLGGVTEAIVGRPKPANTNSDLQSVKANVRGTSESHIIVFGKARVGGVIIGLETSGASNAYLSIALAHSATHAGGCDRIGRIWMDETVIETASITATTTTDTLGQPMQVYSVTAGQFANLVTLYFRRGTSAQGADPILAFLGIGQTTDYARGIAVSHIRLFRDVNDDAAFQKAFQGRIPNITVELYGQRCYDPRLDSTAGGAGSQRANNPSTWAWSDNPAICAATYAIMSSDDGGMGVPPTELNWFSVAAAANVCDQSNGMGGKLYRVSAALQTTPSTRAENLSMLLDSMAGVFLRIGAQYFIYAGAYRTPSFVIDDSWLAGAPQIVPKNELSKLYNAVRISCPDERGGYTNTEVPAYTNAAFEAQDGGFRIYRDGNFPSCPDVIQAQFLGRLMGLKSRRQMQITLPCNFKGVTLDLWETGTVNLSGFDLSGRTFRITQIAWTESGPMLTLSEDALADYGIAGLQAIPPPVTPTMIYARPQAPTGLTGLSIADGVHLSWSVADAYRYDQVQIFRSIATANAYTLRAITYGTAWRDADVNGIIYDYRINLRGPYGEVSDYSNVLTIVGKTVVNGADPTEPNTPTLVRNPGFEAGSVGWTSSGGAWTIAADANARSGTWCAAITAGNAATLTNTARVHIGAGDMLIAYAWGKSTAGAAGTLSVRISWRNASDLQIGTAAGNALSASTAYALSRATGVAPSGTAYAVIQLVLAGATAGTWYADDVSAVPSLRNLDELADGPTYGRLRTNQLSGGNHRLTVAGGGLQLGDARATLALHTGGVRSLFSGMTIDAAYSSASPSVVTLSTSASTLVAGSVSVAYTASSTSVSQSRGSTATYYLYIDDPSYAGGARPLIATVNRTDMAAADGRIYIGYVSVTVPSTGGGGVPPGNPGGGGGQIP